MNPFVTESPAVVFQGAELLFYALDVFQAVVPVIITGMVCRTAYRIATLRTMWRKQD